MLPIIKYRLPETFYIQEKTIPYSSTTVGAFSAKNAIQGDRGFQGRTIPGNTNHQPPKKTLIINYCPQTVDMYYILYHLLDQDFPIYLFYQGKPQRLTSFPIENYQFDRGMDHQTASDALVSLSQNTSHPLRADHILICDYEEMAQLYEILRNLSWATYDEEDAFEQMVLQQWMETKTLPQGKNYPPIYADEPFMKKMGKDGLHALKDSAITLKTTAGKHLSLLPSEKIRDLHVDEHSLSRITENMAFPGVEEFIVTVNDSATLLNKKVLNAGYFAKKLELGKDESVFNTSDEQFIQSLRFLESLSFRKMFFKKYTLSCDFWKKLVKLNFIYSKMDDATLANILKVTTGLKKLILNNVTIELPYATQDELTWEIGCRNTLTELKLSDQVMHIYGHFFKVATQVRKLSFRWHKTDPSKSDHALSMLTEANMPLINELDVSGSTFTEEEFVAVLKFSREYKKLKLDNVTVEAKRWGLSWNGVSLDEVLSIDISNSTLSAGIIRKLFDKARKLEVLSMQQLESYLPDGIDVTPFKNLKYLNVDRNYNSKPSEISLYNAETIKVIMTGATRLIHLSMRNYQELAILNFADHRFIFDEVEELDLSNSEISLLNLSVLRAKMPKLKILKLDDAKITGYDHVLSHMVIDEDAVAFRKIVDGEDALTLRNSVDGERIVSRSIPNKLIQVNSAKATIDDCYAFNSSILQNANPIEMRIYSKEYQQPSARHLLNLTLDGRDAKAWFNRIKGDEKLNIRSLTVSDVTIDYTVDFARIGHALDSVEHLDIFHKNGSEKVKISEARLFEFISLMPNLTSLRVSSTLISAQELINLTKPGAFKYKQALIYSIDKNHLQNEIVAPPNKLISHVYDRDRLVFNNNKSKPLIGKHDSEYELKPLFELVAGKNLNHENIRKCAFKPVFNFKDNSIKYVEIKPNLKPYTIGASALVNPSIYKRHPYVELINSPNDDIKEPWIKLSGLMVYDTLLSVSIAGVRPEDYRIYHSDSDHFYYLCFKNNRLTNTHVDLSYELAPSQKTFEIYPEEIGKIFEPFKRLYQSSPDPSLKTLPLKEQLEAVCEHPEHHSCAERSTAFMYKMMALQQRGIIDDYQGDMSGLHEWPLIRYQNEWYPVETGGIDSKIEYEALPSSQPNLAANKTALSTVNKLPTSIPVVAEITSDKLMKIDEIALLLNDKKQNKNALLVCKNASHLLEMRRYICALDQTGTTVIDNPKDADASSRYLTLNRDCKTWGAVEPKGSEGWLSEELSPENNLRKNILLINWSSFSVSEAVSINTCIDKDNRSIDGVAIDPSVQVIGLIAEGHALLRDSSFTGRLKGSIKKVHCVVPAQSKPHVNDDNALSIELYHSPEWADILLGRLAFINGMPTLDRRKLLGAKSTLPNSVILKNPPKNCQSLDLLVQDLQEGRAFKFYDKNIYRPAMNVQIVHDKCTLDRSKIATINQNVTFDDLRFKAIDHVLTPSTFERCMVSNLISSDGLLSEEKGWLEKDRASSFFITDDLSEEQYAFLLNNATQPLRLYFAPGVTLPSEMNGFNTCHQKMDVPHSLSDTVIIVAPNGPSLDMDAIVIDVSECSSDDILYGFSYRLDDKGAFIFKETVSEVWQALYQGKHVCLSGAFSHELIDHLSTLLLPQGYLWHAGEKKHFKGKLTLMPTYPIDSLTWRKQSPLPSSPLPIVTPQHITVANESERLPALMKLLEVNPWVMIEGDPGVGKSCFKRELYKQPNLTCFSYHAFDNSGLEAWAKSNATGVHLLVIDEAFLWGGERTEFNRLKAKERIMLINQTLHTIADHKKVVFLGNLIPKMPALFDASFPKITFTQLTDAYVIDTILKPIFKLAGKENAAHDFHAQNKSSLTVRALQNKAIIECANEKYSNTVLHSDEYFITPSRLPVYKNVLDILLARRFRQEASEEADSARYGGKPGCWLEGAPRAGKTELIKSALKSLGLKEKSISDMYVDQHGINNLSYYQIPASCNIEALRKHMAYAFQKGAVLKIDELDVLLDSARSSPEQVSRLIAEMNSYLMGEDLNNLRPEMPGFTLLATGNGVTMEGRAVLSAALKSRLHEHHVAPYPQDECKAILFKKYNGLAEKFIASLHLQVEMQQLIRQYHQHPKHYTFCSLMDDVATLKAAVPMPAHGASITSTTASGRVVLGMSSSEQRGAVQQSSRPNSNCVIS